jgi:hypothetical protein
VAGGRWQERSSYALPNSEFFLEKEEKRRNGEKKNLIYNNNAEMKMTFILQKKFS